LSIYRVIDKLEGYVREGTWLPFGHRILSEERLVEYIEKMRSTLPEEVGRAKVIATNKDRVIRDAHEKAQQIVSDAVNQHHELVDQTDIVKQARTTADIVLREAEEKARRIRAGADAYAGQVLAELEMRLATALGSVKKGQDALVPRPAQAPAQPVADAAAKSKRAAFDAQEETASLDALEVTT
jgi:vacuolar-type H+-ATPase subunit H